MLQLYPIFSCKKRRQKDGVRKYSLNLLLCVFFAMRTALATFVATGAFSFEFANDDSHCHAYDDRNARNDKNYLTYAQTKTEQHI